MKEIYIRNIFVDIFLTYYFKYGYQLSLSHLIKSGNVSLANDVVLSRVFSSIKQKIERVNMHNSKNCSFLNLSGILNLPIKEMYPVKFDLKPEEKYWFEFIINMPAEKIFELCDDSRNIREIRRLYSIPESFKEEFLSIFNNPAAINLVRNRFIRGERIDNEPSKMDYFIDYTTGIAHRVN